MALPSNYTRLNYIGTTGTQFIDTGFKPNQNTRVVMDFQSDNDACHIFGARTEFLNKGYLVCWNSDFVYSVQVANSHFNGGVFDLRARHTIDMTASEFKLDGVSQATYSVDAFQAEYNLYLASCPNSSADENMQGKIYSCKIYDNSTLIRDFIPCKNASGTVGMWDNVNSKFYTNAGTGTFVNGGEASGGVLPNGYTQLEYIQSTGTQYIDTGVIGKSGLSVKGTFKINNTGECMLLGCFGGFRCYPLYFDALKMMYGYYTNYPSTNFVITAGQKYTAEVDLSVGNQTIKIDGETKVTSSFSNSYTCTQTMYLFAFNNSGNTSLYASAELYSLQIYDNGILVRDFIPCKNASGTVGLWDNVNSVFYNNKGTGAFVAGTVSDPTAPKGKHNILIDGVSYKIKGGRPLVNGTSYGLVKGRTLVAGTGYDIIFGKVLGDYSEGDIIYLPENGSNIEFYVAKHDYESGLNGSGRTLLVRKDAYASGQWHTTLMNAYASSYIDSWLNESYKFTFETDIRNIIGTTKFPYTVGDGNVSLSTLSRSVFLLSVTELGYTHRFANTEGSALPIANSLKSLYLNGSAGTQWTRSTSTGGDTTAAMYITTYNSVEANNVTDKRLIRPVFTLPEDTLFNSKTNCILV